jgi:tetratricopeptide (TPR) repeat protein
MKKLLVFITFVPLFFIGQSLESDQQKITHNNKGNSFARKNKFKEAIIEYTKAIDVDSNYAKAYINRGTAYAKSGQENKAINDYNNAIEINPRAIDTCIKSNMLPNVYFFRAKVYLNQKKYKESIADFTKAIDLNPNYTNAYYGRGVAYSVLEKHNKAIDDYNKAIELTPTDPRAYLSRGVSKEKSGLSYCSDYKTACYLGQEQACQWYNSQCK